MLAKDAMGGGTSAGQAQAINGAVAATVSAAGTTISDATALTVTNNTITTCAAGAGVKLYDGVISDDMWVYNGTATNDLTVYPATSSQTINQLSAGTGVLLPPYTGAKFKKMTATAWIAIRSA